MTTKPSIALLIPAFNAEDTIKALLIDATNQTRPFDEIIVLDDGSTDQTVAVAKQHGANVISARKNFGVAAARQSLLEVSHSEFVHFHDADDRLNSNYVEQVLGHCQPNSVVVCAMEEVSETGESQIRSHTQLTKSVDKIDYLIDNFLHLNAVAIDRQLALRAGFQTSFPTNEDRLFNYSVAALGPDYRYVDLALVRQQRTIGSLMSRTKTDEIISNFIRGADHARSILPQKNWPTLGLYCLHYAWKELQRGNIVLAKNAVNVAGRCGVCVIPNQGPKVKMASQLLGVWNTMRLRSLWSRLQSAH